MTVAVDGTSSESILKSDTECLCYLLSIKKKNLESNEARYPVSLYEYCTEVFGMYMSAMTPSCSATVEKAGKKWTNQHLTLSSRAQLGMKLTRTTITSLPEQHSSLPLLR